MTKGLWNLVNQWLVLFANKFEIWVHNHKSYFFNVSFISGFIRKSAFYALPKKLVADCKWLFRWYVVNHFLLHRWLRRDKHQFDLHGTIWHGWQIHFPSVNLDAKYLSNFINTKNNDDNFPFDKYIPFNYSKILANLKWNTK